MAALCHVTRRPAPRRQPAVPGNALGGVVVPAAADLHAAAVAAAAAAAIRAVAAVAAAAIRCTTAAAAIRVRAVAAGAAGAVRCTSAAGRNAGVDRACAAGESPLIVLTPPLRPY